jgi:cell division protein FtsA
MNKNDQIVVGLDIGTTKIAVLVGKKNEFGKLEILGIGKSKSVGVTRGEVTNITPVSEAIKKAVADAEQKTGVKIYEVTVGIAGQHIRSIKNRRSMMRPDPEAEITQEDLDQMKRDMFNIAVEPGEAIIDVLAQEYIVDNKPGILFPIGMPCATLEADYHIIVAKVTAVSNIQRAIKNAGLHMVKITLEPLASSESVLSEEEKEAGVALIDIGGGTTDLAIFIDNVIRHTCVIPLGGEVITNDIKEGCCIIKKQAEALKVRFGSALADFNQTNEIISIPGIKGMGAKEISLKTLASIIQARMEEIIEQVYYEIRNSGYERKLHGGIVITGGGAQLMHITQLFQYVTGLDSRIGYPSEHLAHVEENVATPMHSTGIGLVLTGFNLITLNAEKEQAETTVEAKAEVKAEEVVEETKVVEEELFNFEPEVKKKRGFFDSLFDKTRSWLEEENN